MRAMRVAPVFLVWIACGGTPAPRPAQPAPAVQDPASGDVVVTPGTGEWPGGLGEPQPAPPPEPQPAALVARLRDVDGPVPGLDAFVTRRQRDANHCSGTSIATTRVANKAIAKGDEPLAALFELSYPRGLDFSDAHRAASQERFERWLTDLRRVGGAATEHYERAIGKADARAKVIALARLVQISYRVASTVARAELPLDVRTGELAAEKIEAFCDRLAEVAEPLLAQAESAAARCAEAARGVPAGWWTPNCTAP